MRPLEIVLMAANVLTFLCLVVPRLRESRWARVAAPVGVGIAVSQRLIEGWRWQMVPAYAVSVIFLALWAIVRRQSATNGTPSRLASRIGSPLSVVLCVLVIAFSAALPTLIPIFRFPHPTGQYAIGTVTYHWIDSARAEVFTSNPDDRRELMVQLWYPAVANASGAKAPYVEHPEVLAPLAHLFKLPGFVFSHLKLVQTNSVASAHAAEGGPWPVLIFSHGRGGFRQHNTMEVEELVSHGYVVAAIDHPYAATGVVFPDGHMAPFDPRMFDPSHPGHNEFHNRIIPFLAEDASFTLDKLADVNRSDATNILTGRLDLTRVGMFGVSLGGATTAQACWKDARIGACLMMDVFMPNDVLRDGLHQPAMWISRDARSMQLEKWNQQDIDETQHGMRTVFQSLQGDGYLVLVPGAFHPNFSDFPLFSPLIAWLGLIGPTNAARVTEIMNSFSLAFFDKYLKGVPSPLLDHPASRFPEVLFEKHGS